jgi:hypothetical protein
MMLVRFLVAVLAAVAFVVLFAVVDAAWAVALALVVLLLSVLFVVQMVARYTGSEEWLGPEAEAELARDHLVEHETGLPARRHRRDRRMLPASFDVPPDWQGPDGAHRVLLVATDPVSPEQLRAAVADGTRPEDLAVLVIAPALSSGSRLRAFVAPEEAVDHAAEVSHATVDALQDAGIATAGHVGPTDPAVAVAHGLRTYDADEVIVARHHHGPLRRREGVDLDGTADAYGVPLHEISIDRPAVPA